MLSTRLQSIQELYENCQGELESDENSDARRSFGSDWKEILEEHGALAALFKKLEVQVEEYSRSHHALDVEFAKFRKSKKKSTKELLDVFLNDAGQQHINEIQKAKEQMDKLVQQITTVFDTTLAEKLNHIKCACSPQEAIQKSLEKGCRGLESYGESFAT